MSVFGWILEAAITISHVFLTIWQIEQPVLTTISLAIEYIYNPHTVHIDYTYNHI
jgi:hypothetical protein